MSDLVSIPELFRLFRILQSELADLPENPSSIGLLQLYAASHRPEEKGSTENLFDPYQLTSIDNPKGFWCYTPVFYHENQKGNQRRKVPGGQGSWQKKADNKLRAQAWCMQRLEYNEIGIPGKPGTTESLRKFYMKQYTLEHPDDELPKYALCQIYGIKPTQPSASATANEHPGQQTDHGYTGAIAHGQKVQQPPTKLEPVELEQMILPDLINPNDLLIYDQVAQEDHSNIHGDAPGSSIGILQAQGHLTSMRGTPSEISVQNQNSTRKREFRFLVEDLFDGTYWGIEDNEPLSTEIKKTNRCTYDPFRSFDAPQERDIEHGQSSMHSHVAEYGTIGIYETDNLQGNNSGHQSYMPSQEDRLINNQNYQQSYFPMNAFWAGVDSNSLADQRNVQSNELDMPDESSTNQD